MQLSCWVLTEKTRPYTIKAASDSWLSLWKYSKEEAIDRPISLIQHGANEFSAAMLMRRHFQRDGRGTTCANADKFGKLYSHVAYLVPHAAGLLCVSTQIEPRRRLALHEKFVDAHDARPRLGSDVLASVFDDVLRHVGGGAVTHEQRFLRYRDQETAAVPESLRPARAPLL